MRFLRRSAPSVTQALKVVFVNPGFGRLASLWHLGACSAA